ncbi:30S ribosomal protein S31, mitochondrial [Abrus precatorius]|uniref:30S ribosomal protein S31, mitochondrial n=1 Tax=Abrus precatorius TaxID=3816 RepID=A0A8B8LJ26_ABRPR|nr:30S ribosomal protein S31, mitochondrial [Abrus precatorius]
MASGVNLMQRCGVAARWLMTAERATVPQLCGRGDKKTKKGKRFKGSYGNARPKKEKMIERIKDKVEVPSSSDNLRNKSAIRGSPRTRSRKPENIINPPTREIQWSCSGCVLSPIAA